MCLFSSSTNYYPFIIMVEIEYSINMIYDYNCNVIGGHLDFGNIATLELLMGWFDTMLSDLFR